METAPKKQKKYFGVRHLQFAMLFLSLVVGYGIRTYMSVIIIAMIEKTPPHPDIPTYPDWTKGEIILSSFFWGYVLPQIVVGVLVKKFGPKWFLIGAFLATATFTFLTPLIAEKVGEMGVIGCRIIQGMCLGVLFPSIHTLLGKWTPNQEKSRVSTFVYSGTALGTALSLPISGFISDSKYGWPWVCYWFGGLTLGWALLWALLGADSPSSHPRISKEEKIYIEENSESDEAEIEIPWKSILSSTPFWAIFIAQSGFNWGYTTLLTQMPLYMSNILDYEITEGSVFSSLPYFFMWILSFLIGPLADFLIIKNCLSVVNVRRLFQSIGVIIPAIALIILSFVPSSHKTVALVLLVISVSAGTGVNSGFLVNILDLAPNLSGTLMGLTNGPSNIFSILAPLSVKLIDKKETDPELWRIVFLISAGIYIVTDLVYLVWAQGNVQTWNTVKNRGHFEENVSRVDLGCADATLQMKYSTTRSI